MSEVRIPTVLRTITEGVNPVPVPDNRSTVGEALDYVDETYPGFKAQICDEAGAIRKSVQIYLERDDGSADDIRYTSGLETALAVNGIVSVILAVAGGTVAS